MIQPIVAINSTSFTTTKIGRCTTVKTICDLRRSKFSFRVIGNSLWSSFLRIFPCYETS
ncbi:hypothetical protein BGX38DRAFT_1179072 [Terfezia claveryi]|nr:hypothetical protein BGX38DRAFT_1179072 [Terfezia claveryi]